MGGHPEFSVESALTQPSPGGRSQAHLVEFRARLDVEERFSGGHSDPQIRALYGIRIDALGRPWIGSDCGRLS